MLLRGDDNVFNVRRVLNLPQPTHDVLLGLVLNEIAAGVGVVLLQRLEHLLQSHFERSQPLRFDDHLVLLHETAERIHVSNAGHGAQQRPDDVILNGAQLGRVVLLRIFANQCVLKDFSKPGGDRPKLNIDARRQIFPRARQSLCNKLPRKVIVDTVFENNGDCRKADLRNGADLG